MLSIRIYYYFFLIVIFQNCSSILNSGDNKDQAVIIFTMNWLLDFGNFVLEYLDDCLHSQYSCHVVCTFIGALAGDLAGNEALMSRNLKKHKKEFQSQFSGKFSICLLMV